MPSRPPPESDPKAGESEEPETKVTQGSFEALAKGLFNVPRDQFLEAERRFRLAQETRRKKR